jgi:hypothetical protein
MPKDIPSANSKLRWQVGALTCKIQISLHHWSPLKSFSFCKPHLNLHASLHLSAFENPNIIEKEKNIMRRCIQR